MGMFSRWLDDGAERQFAKDDGGRVVFLPRGPRRLAYYVDAPDKYKIKELLKTYLVAGALINVTGSIASLAFTQSLTFERSSASLESKLIFGLVVYLISAIILYIGPALLLRKVYRDGVTGMCSTLPTVEPTSMRLRPPASPSRNALILAVVGVFFLFLLLMLAISYRR